LILELGLDITVCRKARILGGGFCSTL